MKAAIYARFSTDKQRDASIEDQVRECERIAAAHKHVVVAGFEDAAISAGTADRPGYQAMLGAARRREFEIIIVEDILLRPIEAVGMVVAPGNRDRAHQARSPRAKRKA